MTRMNLNPRRQRWLTYLSRYANPLRLKLCAQRVEELAGANIAEGELDEEYPSMNYQMSLEIESEMITYIR